MGNEAGVFADLEATVRDRMGAIDAELAQRIGERDAAAMAIAQLRLERQRLQIALGGFDRAKNPRRRHAVQPAGTITENIRTHKEP